MKNIRHIFILFTIATLSVFFAVDGANSILNYAVLNHVPSSKLLSINPFYGIDIVNFIAIITVGFFGIAAFDAKGKEMGFWGCISSALTAYIYFKYSNWTFVALYTYGAVMDFILLIKGKNQINTTQSKNIYFQIIIVLVTSTVLKLYFDHGIKINVVSILELLTYVLYALGQLLALKQTIWQFSLWIPKNILEFIIGIIQLNPVAIARNCYFLGMNVFAPLNWWTILKQQKRKAEKEIETLDAINKE